MSNYSGAPTEPASGSDKLQNRSSMALQHRIFVSDIVATASFSIRERSATWQWLIVL